MSVPQKPLPIEGATLGYGADVSGVAPASFTTLTLVYAIKPPGGEVEAVKTTSLADTVQKARAGFITDSGEVEFSIWYNPNVADHSFLSGLLVSGAQNPPAVTGPYWWQISFLNDGAAATHAKFVFQAILTKLDPDSEEENNNVTATITLKLVSPVTQTAGT